MLRLCLVLISAAQPAQANEANDPCLLIGTSNQINAFEPAVIVFLERVYKEAGLCVKWSEMPPKRAISQVNAGSLDGHSVRVKAFINHTGQTTFALSPPLFSAQPKIIFLPQTKYDCTPQNLKGRRVSYPLGSVWGKLYLSQVQAEPVPINNISEVPQLLERHRIEFFVYEEQTINAIAATMAQMGLEYKSCLWEPVHTYHILHNRHLDKKEKLEAAMRKVMEEHPLNISPIS